MLGWLLIIVVHYEVRLDLDDGEGYDIMLFFLVVVAAVVVVVVAAVIVVISALEDTLLQVYGEGL